MWREAVSELRLHPSRFVATLLAIAISVGFIAAISVFINSQQNAMGKQASLPISTSDVVISLAEGGGAQAAELAAGVDGVASVDPVPTGAVGFLSKGDRSVTTQLYPLPDEQVRWSQLVDGTYPASDDELALSEAAARELGAAIGDTVEIEGMDQPMRLVGLTDDPMSLFTVIGYVAPHADGGVDSAYQLSVLVDSGADAQQVADALKTQLKGVSDAKVTTGADARTETLTQTTAGLDVFKYLLQGFAAIALLVGMITIANTFTILVAQRRRQLALLRAIGATPGQVTGRLLAESFLLGAIGSVAGIAIGFLVAWIGGQVTGSNYFGLTVVPAELGIAFGVGVLATMVSAVVPALRAARVKPLEALQVVPTAQQARRASVARLIVCVLFAALGVFLLVQSRAGGEWAMVWAVLAGIAITAAVLGGAPLYIAPLLRLVGRGFGWAGPTTRLAFANAARNPRRAASTATALMLAVGLIVTLQVALATMRTTGMEAIAREYPVDVAVSFADGAPEGVVDDLRGTDGVAAVGTVPAKPVEAQSPEDDGTVAWAYAPQDAYDELGVTPPQGSMPSEGTAVAGDWSLVVPDGVTSVTLPGADGDVTLKVVRSSSINYDAIAVSPATLDKLAGTAAVHQVWVQLQDRTSSSSLNNVLKITDQFPEGTVDGGGAIMASLVSQVLDVMLIVLTALLGVAVLIALVGVGNTLGLSVIERQRESALLRALGMQRANLRGMLVVEAIALVGIGTVIGLIAGVFFGWLGVSTVFSVMPEGVMDLRLSLDPWYTLGLILVCLIAAVLASILPGRRAANATPTEALAVE